MNDSIRHTMVATALSTPEGQHGAIAHKVEAMRRAHRMAGPADQALRHDRLERAARLLLENRDALVKAIQTDFGSRAAYQTLAADIATPLKALRHAQANLAAWMADEPVESPIPGMGTHVQYQALGVVGIISPWNFPLNLAFSPLAGVLAAGNVALLKPSELTPHTSDLLATLVARYFDPMEVDTVLGDAAVGAAFSQQAFDHLVFTGSTSVGRHVMRAAAEHLVPVTLELGGKSPVMIDTDADIAMAAERTLTIKSFNAGQICISPDYVLLPRSAEAAFVERARSFMAETFPTVQANPDYTAIISERHYQRLQGLIEDARQQGATVVSLAPQGEPTHDDASRKIAPVLVLGAHDGMKLMQEEIFGPILPVVRYDEPGWALDYVNSHPRPLAAYYFGPSEARQQAFAQSTVSGALVINDLMTHASVETLPFGGVGPAGMGAYHGVHGFRRFSHARAVVVQTPQAEANLRLRAPYADKLQQLEALLQQAQDQAPALQR
jgi:coniferyl-aldehyde dehydrogenase